MKPLKAGWTAATVCRAARVNYNTLMNWKRRGIIRASVSDPNLQWQQTLFSRQDVLDAAILGELQRMRGNGSIGKTELEALKRACGGADVLALQYGDAVSVLLKLDVIRARVEAALTG